MSLIFRPSCSAVYFSLKFRKKGRFDYQHFDRNHCSKSDPVVSFIHNTHPIEYLRNKINNLIIWYEEMSGLKDVRIAQDNVTKVSDRLAALQEERRQASAALSEIQNKLKQIYAELDNTKRGDDRYVQLISEENKLLKEEDIRQAKFKDAERAEREQFIFLTNAVKNSHEKERFQSKKTQYWSIIGSITGAVLGIVGTSINNHIRLSKLKELVHESAIEEFREKLEKYIENAEKTANKISNLTISEKNNSVNNKSLEEILHNLSAGLAYAQEENRQIKDIFIIISFLCFVIPVVHCLCR